MNYWKTNKKNLFFIFSTLSVAKLCRVVFYFVSSSNFERVQILHGCNFYTSVFFSLVNIFDGSISLTTILFPGSYNMRTYLWNNFTWNIFTYSVFTRSYMLYGSRTDIFKIRMNIRMVNTLQTLINTIFMRMVISMNISIVISIVDILQTIGNTW